MSKYNLTFWQRLGLIPLWFFWVSSTSKTIKSWHEVKKGLETHDHKFTVPFSEGGHDFLACNHEGCSVASSVEYQNQVRDAKN